MAERCKLTRGRTESQDAAAGALVCGVQVLATVKKVALRALGPSTIEESDLVYALYHGQRPGVLIEVGAHEGDGTLRRFAADGWEVHAFEPDPINYELLASAVQLLPTVTTLPVAVSDKPGTMTLYRSPESSGISTLAPFTESHEPVGNVEVVTLADYLGAAGRPDEVTILKIDVEGFERFVLDGFPWESHRPDTVVLEFEDAKSRRLGYGWKNLADFLVQRGYEVLVSEWFPIEKYGIVHEWRRFARYPTELEDSRAWGNLIATSAGRIGRLERNAARAASALRMRRRILSLAGRSRGE